MVVEEQCHGSPFAFIATSLQNGTVITTTTSYKDLDFDSDFLPVPCVRVRISITYKLVVRLPCHKKYMQSQLNKQHENVDVKGISNNRNTTANGRIDQQQHESKVKGKVRSERRKCTS